MYKCPTCGSPFEKGEALCNKCGYDIENNFLYTSNSSEDVNSDRDDLAEPITSKPYYSESDRTYVYPKAPLRYRYVALFFDGVFIPLLALPFFLLYHFADTIANTGSVIYDTAGLLSIILMLAIPITYAFIKDGLSGGQGFGKKRAGIMVVNLATNEPCAKGKSALRNLVMYFPYVIFVECIMAFANKKGKRLGDLLADTQVIRIDDYAPQITRKAPDTMNSF